jgi:hypothetical protein
MAKRRKRVAKRKPTRKKVVRRRPAARRMAMRPSKKPPVLAWLVLVVAVLWLLNAWGVLAFELPWLPLVVVLLAIGMVWHKYKCW